MSDELSRSLIGTTFAGRYKLEAFLGSGGAGAVYVARHEIIGRKVALKLLHRQFLSDPAVTARFEREARAISRIVHPGITEVIDYGHSDEGVPYLILELVDGTSLADVLDNVGPLPVSRAAAILLQMAEALMGAHDVGVIHRDLKPGNIMLSLDPDGRERVRILDFGMAKIVGADAGPTLTAVGTAFGTPAYMSPEQVRGERVDNRTDIYSFGIVAYELLTGLPPFHGKLMEIVRAHLDVDPQNVTLRSGRVDIPGELGRLVMNCLIKESHKRPGDAAQLVQVLEQLQA